MARETAWLIEQHWNNTLYYWSAGGPSNRRTARGVGVEGWNSDPEAAIRFCREQDAMVVLSHLLNSAGRVAEHAWGVGNEQPAR